MDVRRNNSVVLRFFSVDNNAQNIRGDDDDGQEQPPAYEAPPNYEEASSLNFNENSERSRRMSECTDKKRKRSRSRYLQELLKITRNF